ncbi:MAG: hypothetical protein IPP82_06365 [Xanthomonadales bacterium]|nr:hypothetical protein [Xanthomonadales bacterium]
MGGVEVVQIAGALMLLICFLLAQSKRMSPEGYPYLLLNLVGSAIMTMTALITYQWGFVFMEGVWALFSAWGLMQRIRGGTPTEIH